MDDTTTPDSDRTVSGRDHTDRSDESRESGPTDESPGGSREVVVPMRLYKTVTVFSTLLAIVSVIGGFLLLDAATQGATLPLSAVSPVLALAGLALIVLGGAIYAFSTRFRTAEMGNAKDDDDEG